jgi:hypothetical protein
MQGVATIGIFCSPAQGSERERCLHQLSSTQVPAVSFSSK